MTYQENQPPYQPPYQPPSYQPPPPTPPPTKRKRTGLVVAIVCAAVLAVVIAAALGYGVGQLGASSAKVGDCIEAGDTGSRAQKRDCSDAKANYVVLGIETTIGKCAKVVGVEAAYEVGDEKVLCVGVKGADVNQAVNGAKVGECLKVTGNDAERDPSCAAGSRPILKLVTDQMRATGNSDGSHFCFGVDGADVAYTWSIETTPKQLLGRYDFVFCLGPEK